MSSDSKIETLRTKIPLKLMSQGMRSESDFSPQKILTKEWELRLQTEMAIDRLLNKIMNPVAMVDQKGDRGSESNLTTNINTINNNIFINTASGSG